MAQATYRQPGGTINYTPGSVVTAGDVVVQGARCCVAPNDIAADVLGALNTGGVYDVVKVTGVFAVNAALYWDADGDPLGGTAGTGCLTTVSTANTFFGFAVVAAAETDTTVRVVLVWVPSITIHNPLTAAIADPGDAGAIPVVNSGSVSIVTAGAETRTIAIPTAVGQQLSVYMKTDVGDCTITVASAINETGNNTILLDDPGEHIVLVGVDIGGTLFWRVLASDGATLSTV